MPVIGQAALAQAPRFGSGGPPRCIERPERSNQSGTLSASGNRGAFYRLVAGHGLQMNAILVEVTTTSSDTISVAYARQGSTGALTSDADGVVIASSGSIPSPAVGLVTIPLGITVTVDVERDWFGFSASGATTAVRSEATNSTISNLIAQRYGTSVQQFRHPLAIGSYIVSTINSGWRSPLPCAVGVMV